MRKILVVDDDELINEFISDAAELVGVATTAVTNGRDIQTVNLNQYDHILLDLSIPGADGVQLLRLLKNKHYQGAISITSGCEASVLNSAQQIGQSYGLRMHSPLVKPFALERLLNVIQEGSQLLKTKVEHAGQNIDQEKLLPQLESAIKNKEIDVYYQPKFDIEQLSILGVEALARWRLHDGTMIPPPVFIKLAEQNALIDELTNCIIEKVLPQLKKWLLINVNLQVSINLSAFSLNNLDLPDGLARQAEHFNIPNRNIILELTESALAEDTSKSAEILTRLRMKGFGLSIDDFGTGYSSIQQLQEVPFNELKIDKSFTANYSVRPQSKTIIESTIEMAHKLGIHVVAEGIEDEKTLEYLREVDCDQGQGYFYAKPMSDIEFNLWLHNHPEYLQEESHKADKLRLLILSRDVVFTDTVTEVLSAEFDVEAFDNEKRFIESVQTHSSAVLFIDISSETQGLELCSQLADRVKGKHTLVVTGADNKNQKLNALSTGCDDYFIKSDSVGQLLGKFRAIKQFQINKSQQGKIAALYQTEPDVDELVYYKALTQVYSQLIVCQDKAGFVGLVFELANQLSWDICLKVESLEGIKSYRAPDVPCTPMEESAFILLTDAGSFYQFNQRLILNAKHVKILFNNCPALDTVWFHQFCISFLNALEKKWRELNHFSALMEMCASLEQALVRLKGKVSTFEQDAHSIIDSLLLDIRANLITANPNLETEKKLIELIEASVAKVLNLGESGREIDIEFSHIITQYKHHHFDGKQ